MNAYKKEKSGFRKLCIFALPYKYMIISVVIVALLGTAIDILIVYFLQELIHESISRDSGAVINIMLRVLVIIIFGVIVKFIVKKITILLGVYIVRDIRLKVFHYISVISFSYLDCFNSGDIVSRFTNDLFVIQNFLQYDMYNLIYYPLLIMSTFIYMSTINWRLVLVSSILTPLIIFLTGRLSTPVTKYTKAIQENLGKANLHGRECVLSASTIKAYNLKLILKGKYQNIMKELLEKNLLLERIRSVLAPSAVILRLSPYVLCILYGGYMMVQERLDIAGFIAFFPLLNYMIQPTAMIPYYINGIRTVTAVADHIFEIFDQPLERQDGKVFSLEDKTVMLEFETVSFQYDQTNILENLSFKLEKGKIIVIIGLSGSGKSTILKLVCGFYEPEKGSIKLGETEYSKWKLKNARENIAIVAQDNYLFPSSIADNISCGNTEVKREDIINAAKDAGAHEFIMELSDGYDTVIGEFGTGISGGQRQRIAIARALLKKATILLFDEPTSALDAQSEALFYDTLEKLKGKCSILIVSHRLAVTRLADENIVLEGGHIIEKGSHDQLMKKDGLYKTLYNKQQDVCH